ncbi:hypothetical protein GCM10025876_34420 [Demequina litorisediminis]|uniref:PTS system fructose-specific EIIABC component n=1 Tax=Demequina litorisediminis TaxID=1849022 RepID=A0ABQ6IH82_9MICO|nr:hypothetical protein GCM10025876_34420 [Demequina litorisediminis]
MPLIDETQVVLDLTADDRHAATRVLAERLVATGRCTDLEAFLADVRKREETMATGLPGGIAIPHARSAAITKPTLGFGRLATGLDWGAKDGAADLVFLIAAPEGGGEAHMQVLPKLAKALMKKEFTAALRSATSDAEVVALVQAEVGEVVPAASAAPAPAPAPAPVPEASAAAEPAGASAGLTLVGVTSCPTGIAHTYMAAEALERAAADAGHTMLVETQGSAGANPLTPEQIAAADAVIFAHDVEVRGADRFAGKPLIDVGVKKAISDGPGLIAQAATKAAEWRANPEVRTVAPAAGATGGLSSKVDTKAGIGTQIRQWLMTGVAYMIPFVAAGGILIALSFMLSQVALGESGAIEIVKYNLTSDDAYNIAENFDIASLTAWAALLYVIGAASFGFLVPILSGFIAFAIADRPGLVPGIVGGSVAASMGAGFLGGIVTGVLGGLVAKWIASWKVHKGVRGVMPVVVIPLLSSLHHPGPVHHPPGWTDLCAVRCPQRVADQPAGRLRVRAWPHPWRDDGLRPRWSRQQGRVLLRHGWFGRRRYRHRRTGADHHGRRHGGRHGRPARHGARHHLASEGSSPSLSARTARPRGCWEHRSSLRARSPSRRQTPSA